MAEFIPQLSSSPQQGRRVLQATSTRTPSSGHSRDDEETFSPFRDMSPYFPSNGDESASERETVDGSVLLSSPELAGMLLLISFPFSFALGAVSLPFRLI